MTATLLEENLLVPFATKLLGIEVTVERVDLNKVDEIVAVCRRGRKRLRVPVIDLPLPEPKPKGQNELMPTGDELNGNDRFSENFFPNRRHILAYSFFRPRGVKTRANPSHHPGLSSRATFPNL